MGCSLVLLPTAKMNPRAISVPHASKTFHPAVHEMSARDDLRLRHRSRSAALAAAGALLIVASLVTRPRGLCGLVASPTVESGVLTLAGIVLLSAGIVALVIGSRRFRHHATAGHFFRGKRIPASSTCQRCSFPPVWGRVNRSITTSHSSPTRPKRSPAGTDPASTDPASSDLAGRAGNQALPIRHG